MGIERDRVRLAACVRLLHMEGLLTYNGHVSVRIPDANRFLIHSLVDSRAEVSGALIAGGFRRPGFGDCLGTSAT